MADSLRGKRFFLYISVCISNLIAFCSGILYGWSSPVCAILTDEDRIDENPLGVVVTPQQIAWIVSALGLGAVFGPIMAVLLTNKIGRKRTLLFFSGAPLLISFLMLAFGKTIILYCVARFIAGFAFGNMLSVLPQFLSEISEDTIRGMVSSSILVFLMTGTLYAYVVGPYLSIMWFNLSCAFWPTLFFVLFLLFVPESPYYFIFCNDPSSAMKSLTKFRSDSESNVMNEMETMKLAVEQDKKSIGSFSDVFKSKSSIKAFIISVSLVSFQQLSGIVAILFYSQTIFSATSAMAPEISTIIIGVVQFSTSFITPLTVDRFGRKILLLISAIGMCIAEAPLGLYFYLSDNGKDVSSISWLPMVCLIVYITSYNFGFGIVPFTVTAEIFPTNIKVPASTATASVCSLIGFAVSFSFNSLNTAIGMGGSFWLFSAFSASAVPFLIFYMIETKGRSFQEIQNILAK